MNNKISKKVKKIRISTTVGLATPFVGLVAVAQASNSGPTTAPKKDLNQLKLVFLDKMTSFNFGLIFKDIIEHNEFPEVNIKKHKQEMLEAIDKLLLDQKGQKLFQNMSEWSSWIELIAGKKEGVIFFNLNNKFWEEFSLSKKLIEKLIENPVNANNNVIIDALHASSAELRHVNSFKVLTPKIAKELKIPEIAWLANSAPQGTIKYKSQFSNLDQNNEGEINLEFQFYNRANTLLHSFSKQIKVVNAYNWAAKVTSQNDKNNKNNKEKPSFVEPQFSSGKYYSLPNFYGSGGHNKDLIAEPRYFMYHLDLLKNVQDSATENTKYKVRIRLIRDIYSLSRHDTNQVNGKWFHNRQPEAFNLEVMQFLVDRISSLSSFNEEIEFNSSTTNEELSSIIKSKLSKPEFSDGVEGSNGGERIRLKLVWESNSDGTKNLKLYYSPTWDDGGNNWFVVKYDVDQTIEKTANQNDHYLDSLKVVGSKDLTTHYQKIIDELNKVSQTDWNDFLKTKKTSWISEITYDDVLKELKTLPSVKAIFDNTGFLFNATDVILEINDQDISKLKIKIKLNMQTLFEIELNNFKNIANLVKNMTATRPAIDIFADLSLRLPSDITKKEVLASLMNNDDYLKTIPVFWKRKFTEANIDLKTDDDQGSLIVTIKGFGQNKTITYTGFSTNVKFNGKQKNIVSNDGYKGRYNAYIDVYYEDETKIIKQNFYEKEWRIDLLKGIKVVGGQPKVFKVIVKKHKEPESKKVLKLEEILEKIKPASFEDFQEFHVTLNPAIKDLEHSHADLLFPTNSGKTQHMQPTFKWVQNDDGSWNLQLIYNGFEKEPGQQNDYIYQYTVVEDTNSDFLKYLFDITLENESIQSIFTNKENLPSEIIKSPLIKAQILKRIEKLINDRDQFHFNVKTIENALAYINDNTNNAIQMQVDDNAGKLTVIVDLSFFKAGKIFTFKINDFKTAFDMQHEAVIHAIDSLKDTALDLSWWDQTQLASSTVNQTQKIKENIKNKINDIINNDPHYTSAIKKEAVKLVQESDISFLADNAHGNLKIKIDATRFNDKKKHELEVTGFMTNNQALSAAIKNLKDQDFQSLSKDVRPKEISVEQVLKLLKNGTTAILKDLTNTQKALLTADDIKLEPHNTDGTLEIVIQHHGEDQRLALRGFLKTFDVAKTHLASLITHFSNELISSSNQIQFNKAKHADDIENNPSNIQAIIKSVIMQEIANNKITQNVAAEELKILQNIVITIEHDNNKGTFTILIDTSKDTGVAPHKIIINGFLTNQTVLKRIIDSLESDDFKNQLKKDVLPNKAKSHEVFVILSSVLKNKQIDEGVLDEQQIILKPNNTEGKLSISISYHGEKKTIELEGFLTLSDVAPGSVEDILGNLSQEVFANVSFDKKQFPSASVNNNDQIKEQIVEIVKQRIQESDNEDDVKVHAHALITTDMVSFHHNDKQGILDIIIDNGKNVPGAQAHSISISEFLSDINILKRHIHDLQTKDFTNHFNKDLLPNSISPKDVLDIIKNNVLTSLTPAQKSSLHDNDVTLDPNNTTGSLKILIKHHGQEKEIIVNDFQTIASIAKSHLSSLVSHMSNEVLQDVKFDVNVPASDPANNTQGIKSQIVAIIKQKIENSKDQSKIKNEEKKLINEENIILEPDDGRGTIVVKIDLSKINGAKAHEIEINGFSSNAKLLAEVIANLDVKNIDQAFDKTALPRTFDFNKIKQIILNHISQQLTAEQLLSFEDQDIEFTPSNSQGTLLITIKHHGLDKEIQLTGFVTTEKIAQKFINYIFKNNFKLVVEKVHFDKEDYASAASNNNQDLKNQVVELLKVTVGIHKDKKVVTFAKTILENKQIKFQSDDKNGSLSIIIEDQVANKATPFTYKVNDFLTDKKLLSKAIAKLSDKQIIREFNSTKDKVASQIEKEFVLAKLKALLPIKQIPLKIANQLQEENIKLIPNDAQGTLKVTIEKLGTSPRTFVLQTQKSQLKIGDSKIIENSHSVPDEPSSTPTWKYILISVGALIGVGLIVLIIRKLKASRK